MTAMCAALCLACASEASAQRRFKSRVLSGTATGNAPVAPILTLTTPTDGAEGRQVTVSLNYTYTGDCDAATLYLDKSNATTVAATDASCDGSFTSADYDGPLDDEAGYVWKVRLCNQGACDTATVRAFTTAAMGALSLLTTADLTCAGMFLAPNMGTSTGWTTTFPTALRVTGASRTYFTMSGDNGHIAQYDEPASLSPCSTAVGSIVQQSTFTDLGQYPTVHNANEVTPQSQGGLAWGLNYDEARDYLWMNWSATYTDLPNANSFAAATISGGSLHLVGCWGLNTRLGEAIVTGTPMSATATIVIPEWFVDAHLPAGHNIGLGMGGNIASVTSGNSYGPSVEAIGMPSGNACAAATNTLLSPGTLLTRFPGGNTNGPNCSFFQGRAVGCDTSALTPTTPSPAQLQFTGYSINQYVTDWDPYGGHGWWNSFTGGVGNWYDDGQKTGLVYVIGTPAGWINTPVLASPAPTVSYPNITFSVASTSTHDGHHMQAGDIIWVTTCEIGVTPNGAGEDGIPGNGDDTLCEATNNNEKSFVVVDTVNTSTGAVTGHITVPDFGGGDHKPLATTGVVWAGVVYAHGAPVPSRATILMQIYDPADLASVADGDLPSYSPVAAEEIDFAATFVPQFGCPGCAIPGMATGASAPQPTSLQVDPENHKIVVFYRNAVVNRSLGVVFDVAH